MPKYTQPRKTWQYTTDFKIKAVKLSLQDGLQVKQVAEGLDIHPFIPLDFIARLVALVPKPRVNFTRFHGVFAPNSKYRVLVTPAKRGKGSKLKAPR